MPVYMIYICHSVSDRALLEKYWSSIGPTLEGQPIKLLAAYTPFEVLEGENVLGVVIAEWPSMEAAKAWYDSPGYKAIRHLRQNNAKYTGVLVDAGLAPPEERLRTGFAKGLSRSNEKRKAMIIDHIYLPVSDLIRSSEFYKKMLEPLGIDMPYEVGHPPIFGFAINNEPGFWLKKGEVAKDLYVAFTARSADAVRASYKSAIDAGATSIKEPSLRPEWRPDYFAANIGDPDGYHIEIAYKPWLYK